MTAGLATVAGSVLVAYMGMLGPQYAGHLVAASFMAAPAAIAMAKLMVPEEGVPRTSGDAHVEIPRTTVNAIDAAASGAIDGVRLALNIGGMLVAFVALIHMADALLGWVGRVRRLHEPVVRGDPGLRCSRRSPGCWACRGTTRRRSARCSA